MRGFTNISKETPLKITLFFLGILLFSTFHTTVFGSQQNSKPITIAAIYSLSGIAAPHNEPLLTMTQLAVEHINNTGGVLGRPLQLVTFDNQSTPIGSAIAAKKVILHDIPAVIGAHWSSHSLAMAQILQEAEIPMISPGSTNPDVTKDKSYIFRACFIDSFQGVAMAKFAYDDLQAKTAAVAINIDEDYSTTLAKFFSSAFTKKGGAVVTEINYRGNATDFAENIKQIASAKPDIVYIPGYTRDSGLFIRQARKLGLQAIFLGGDAWDEIEKAGADSVNGSFQTAPWHPEVPFYESKKMKELYQEKYGGSITNMSSPLAYDAVMILAKAIKRAGSTSPEKVRQALAETRNYLGATGTISFDENGDPINKGAIILEFKNNKRIFKKTVAPE